MALGYRGRSASSAASQRLKWPQDLSPDPAALIFPGKLSVCSMVTASPGYQQGFQYLARKLTQQIMFHNGT